MTVFLGSEVITAAVKAKLQANMPTRVEAINVEKNDDVTVAVPDINRYFTAARRLIAPGGSAILIMDGPMTILRGGEGFHSLSTVTKVGVWVMDEDADEERLSLRLLRLTRAVIESLWDGDPKEQLNYSDGTPQLAWKLWPEQTVPGTPYQPEGPGSNLREFYLTVFAASRLEGS